MKELIKIDENNKVDGRELYAFLHVKTPYTMWFERMCEYGFTENADYWTANKNVIRDDGAVMPQKRVDHTMTISMAKEISMIQRNERGKQARLYFIECENKLKTLSKPMNQLEVMAESIRILQEQENRIRQVEQAQDAQEQRLIEIESKQMTIDKHFYTIAGYANLKGMRGINRKAAVTLGKQASGLSKRRGYEIGKEYDARYGNVNTYHEDVLKEVFRGLFQ